MDKINTRVITTDEAARLLGVTRQTLYKLAERREIPGKKIGRKYRFLENNILSYISTHNSSTPSHDSVYHEWELKGDFATEGLKKMAKRTFQELSSNIEELIANSYDADATNVKIIINHDKQTLSIIDDGIGMDEKALTSFVIYGKSDKDSNFHSPKFGRSAIGEYGMGGKLAITNISRRCKIITRKNGFEHIFNMNRADLDKAKYISDLKSKVLTKHCNESLHGTEIYMEDLFSRTIDTDRLQERFSTKMPLSQNFQIALVLIDNNEKTNIEIHEPIFDFDKKFEFEENLSKVGPVKMVIYFTKEPIPAAKQGVWTKVNGRIVNEKAEWFDLFRATSGARYRYRLFGYGEANGLKDYVTFSKNDFIDCPEYAEYWSFGHKNILKVQNTLLKEDENAKREQDRTMVKTVEKEVNEIVSKLDDPMTLGLLEAKIKKEYTKEKESAPETPYPNVDVIEKEAEKIASTVKRGKDKRERRNQSIAPSERVSYSGKNYIIIPVDLSETGDIVKFTKERNLIEINEKHPLYDKASRNNSLQDLIMNLSFTEIAYDYSEGNFVSFDMVFNELARIASKRIRLVDFPDIAQNEQLSD
jgi:excisionase family DNA binding protein